MLAANVGAVLISFIALVALVNLALGWLGGLAGRPDLSLQWLLSLVFAPCAWLLGVPSQDCQAIGGLLGTRTVLNEMIAYFDLGRMKETLTPKAFSLATIAMADHLGMPVSTTHVLSSGVAGTMWANKSGIQAETVKEIALAWILTLPVAMTLSGGLYWLATWFVG